MQLFKICLVILIVLLFSSCEKKQPVDPDTFLKQEYWVSQATNDILPYWTKHVVDSANGSFYSTLDVDWKPVNDTIRFPSMIARHLFSYSAGYLMSGDEQYISMARKIKDYLLTHAWDNEHGGWFDSLTPDGKPLQKSKSTFVQVYVITGLAMYYIVTHDPEVLDHINRSNELLEEKVWDHENGGYFDNINEDWSRRNDIKSFSSQLAPVSGYLLYLYLATHNEQYLTQSERILDVVMEKMTDAKTGWILESFDKEWNYQASLKDENEINIGHNVEVAWSLLRMYMINNNADYLTKGKTLADNLHKHAFDSTQGVWFASIGNEQPEKHSDYTHWWIQAYGQMMDLCLARIYPDEGYVDSFKKGAAFWDNFFLDKERGDTYLSVMNNGEVKDDRKANQFKASYHNVEHCLLNSLYLSCWINADPVTLHFKITSSVKGEPLYPFPIEVADAAINDIEINKVKYQSKAKGFIKLPPLNGHSVTLLNCRCNSKLKMKR